MWEWIKCNYQLITAISSVLIAAASVIIAWRALWLSKKQHESTVKHNKLSTIPSLTTTVSSTHFRFMLENRGLGPAMIKKVVLFHKDDSILLSTNKRDVNEAEFLRKIFGLNYGDRIAGSLSYFPKSAMFGTGQEMPILTVNKEKSDVTIEMFTKLAWELDLYIEYESVYGDSFVKGRMN